MWQSGSPYDRAGWQASSLPPPQRSQLVFPAPINKKKPRLAGLHFSSGRQLGSGSWRKPFNCHSLFQPSVFFFFFFSHCSAQNLFKIGFCLKVPHRSGNRMCPRTTYRSISATQTNQTLSITRRASVRRPLLAAEVRPDRESETTGIMTAGRNEALMDDRAARTGIGSL